MIVGIIVGMLRGLVKVFVGPSGLQTRVSILTRRNRQRIGCVLKGLNVLRNQAKGLKDEENRTVSSGTSVG